MAESQIAARLANFRQHRMAPVILELDLTEGITEARPGDPVSAITARNRAVLADVLDGLRRARDDDRVTTLVARLGGKSIGLAAVQELRRAVTDFAAAGKTTFAWAESFGEFSASNVQYYLATAFEKVWLQPSGDLGLTGIAVERIFLRGLLDKVGADFEVAKRHEYKSAAEQLTETRFSEPARQATERMTESVTEQLVEAIAERRGLTREKVSELIDAGPFLASRALAEGLVDQLGYRDEVYKEARKLAGPDCAVMYLGRYQRGRAVAERVRAHRHQAAWQPRASHGAHLCHRPDPPRPERARTTVRELDGLGHDRRGDQIRGTGHPRDRAAREQPRRLLCRLGHDLARGRPGQDRRHAGRCVDGRRRRLGRLLHLDGG